MLNEQMVQVELRRLKRELWRKLGRLLVAVMAGWSWTMFALAAMLHWSERDLIIWGVLGISWSLSSRDAKG
jgi:hypothetical protein